MSEAISDPANGLTTVAEGEWTGWLTWVGDPFEQRAGPFYERVDERGPVCAFRAEPRHLNGDGTVHGGCLMTFADSALFTIARDHLVGARAVTLNLAADYLDAARAGELIEARGEVTRGGKSTVFVRGMATADGRPVLSFNGIIRKVGVRNGATTG